MDAIIKDAPGYDNFYKGKIISEPEINQIYFFFADFMKEKKRTNAVLATAAKKRDFAGISTAAGASAAAMVATSEDLSSGCSWGEMPPAKRMRTGSAASSCSSVGS